MKNLILTLALLASPAFAATHYVSFTNGLDTNNGTAKATPWKHTKGMTGCASNCSSYTPAAGDLIIFFGGDTWPVGSLPLTVPTSGSTGNPIYYGVDTTWFTGTNSGTVNTSGTTVRWASGDAFQMNGSWAGGSIVINSVTYTIASVPNPSVITLTTSAGTQTGVAYSNSLFVRPIFDAQGLGNALINISTGSASFVTFDSIELTGEMMKASTDATVYAQPTSGNVILTNMDVHNWRRCTGSGAPTAFCTAAMSDNTGGAGGIYFNGFAGLSGVGDTLSNSNVGSPEAGGNLGSCSRAMMNVKNNYLHDCTGANLHGGALVVGNIVNNVGNDFTSCTEHGNGFYLDFFSQGGTDIAGPFTVYVYNNYITNMGACANATAIYPNPGTSGVASNNVTYYVFNNVVGGTGSDIADEIDAFNSSAGQAMNAHDWNNTFVVNAGGTCTNVVSRSGLSMNAVDVRNLHCIATSGGTTFNSDGTTTPTSSNLLLQTVATANGQGYISPTWIPTSGSGSTVGTGTNLSANCSGTLAALCSSTTLGGLLTPVTRPTSWDEGAFQFTAAAGSSASGGASWSGGAQLK